MIVIKIISYIVILAIIVFTLYSMWNGLKINLVTGKLSIEYELYPLSRLFIK